MAGAPAGVGIGVFVGIGVAVGQIPAHGVGVAPSMMTVAFCVAGVVATALGVVRITLDSARLLTPPASGVNWRSASTPDPLGPGGGSSPSVTHAIERCPGVTD